MILTSFIYSHWKAYAILWFCLSMSMLLFAQLNLTTDCVGCFNPQSGLCLLNPDDTCKPFTKSQCLTKGQPWRWSNTSMNSWPSGCLAQVRAVGFPCGGLLPTCPADNYYLSHANTAKLCGESAEAANVKIFGYDDLAAGNPDSYNCFAIKTFNAGCVWQDWDYYSVNNDGKLLQKKICGTSHDEV